MCKYYKVNEVAEVFKVRPITVRRWCKSGKIKAKKLGKSWYIHKDELVLFDNVTENHHSLIKKDVKDGEDKKYFKEVKR